MNLCFTVLHLKAYVIHKGLLNLHCSTKAMYYPLLRTLHIITQYKADWYN